MSAVLEQTDFEQNVGLVSQESAAIQIVDQLSYDVAAEKFRGASALEKEIVEHYRPLKDKAYQSHRAICEAEKKMLGPVQEAKTRYSRMIGDWDREQERLRLEEERRLEAEAKKRADEEAEKLALDAIEQGASEEEIDSIIEEAKVTPTPIVHASPTYKKASGVFTRETWQAIADPKDSDPLLTLIKAAALNPPAFKQYLSINMTAANQAARNQKSAFRVPGLIAKSDRGAVSKGK